MEKLTMLTQFTDRISVRPRPLTPAQAFEAHVAMCFECHHRNMFETGFGYCPEAYRILAEMA
jgi:hypothetical protein